MFKRGSNNKKIVFKAKVEGAYYDVEYLPLGEEIDSHMPDMTKIVLENISPLILRMISSEGAILLGY